MMPRRRPLARLVAALAALAAPASPSELLCSISRRRGVGRGGPRVASCSAAPSATAPRCGARVRAARARAQRELRRAVARGLGVLEPGVPPARDRARARLVDRGGERERGRRARRRRRRRRGRGDAPRRRRRRHPRRGRAAGAARRAADRGARRARRRRVRAVRASPQRYLAFLLYRAGGEPSAAEAAIEAVAGGFPDVWFLKGDGGSFGRFNAQYGVRASRACCSSATARSSPSMNEAPPGRSRSRMRAKRSSPTPPLLVALPLSLALSLRYRGARACASLAQFLARHTGRLPVAPIVARGSRRAAAARPRARARLRVRRARAAVALALGARAPPPRERAARRRTTRRRPTDGRAARRAVEVPDDGAADGARGSAADPAIARVACARPRERRRRRGGARWSNVVVGRSEVAFSSSCAGGARRSPRAASRPPPRCPRRAAGGATAEARGRDGDDGRDRLRRSGHGCRPRRAARRRVAAGRAAPAAWPRATRPARPR